MAACFLIYLWHFSTVMVSFIMRLHDITARSRFDHLVQAR